MGLIKAGMEHWAAHTLELSDALNDVLSKTWKEKRGIEVFSFNINSLSIPDDQRLKLSGVR